MTETPTPIARFVFCVCQVGIERIAKKEILARHPYLAFAFSRPGFVTFKVQPGTELPESFELKSTWVRTSGWSLGNVSAKEVAGTIADILPKIADTHASCIHVWQRDAALPGENEFEPGISPLAASVSEQLTAMLQQQQSAAPPVSINQIAQHGETVFDIAIVEPESWWLGWHKAFSMPRRWPGGVPILDRSKPVISRAYWKLAEAIAWSRFPLAAGQTCIELGAAPGGACQFLLEQGLKVIAVDPALLDARVAEHPQLTHLRCRTREIKRSRLKGAKWLFADLNVAPSYTLDAVGDIVKQPNAAIEGMLLTLKMMSEDLDAELPGIIARVKELGFEAVFVRQLAYNRREVCLMASREKS